MLVKKNKAQRDYLLSLKDDVVDYVSNFKKRYRLFPWTKVSKVSKREYNNQITINGAKYTVKELTQEINKTKTKISTKLRPSYFNFVLRGYIRDAKNLEGQELKKTYQNYKAILEKEFKNMRMDFEFSVNALKELNKFMKSNPEVVNESALIEEKTIFSENDLVYNLESFKQEKYHNVLLITGLSGSGKTTTGYKLAYDYKAELFQLDWIEHPEEMQNSPETPNYGLWQFVKSSLSKVNIIDWHEKVIFVFELILKFAMNHPNKLFIVEGIQIPGHLHNYQGIMNFPIIIKGTSVGTSIIRRFKRDNINQAIKTGDKNILKYYHDSEKYLNMFRNQLREEDLNESVNNSINTIIFDFGGVLVKGTQLKQRRDLFERKLSDKEIETMVNGYFSHADNFEGLNEEEAKNLWKRYLPENLHKYVDDSYSVVFGSINVCDYTIPLLQALKERGFKLYYLSNWCKCGFELCKKNGHFDFLKYFDGGVVSYEVGLLKPGKEIYQLLIDKYKLNPHNCIFYDDKKENVNAAKSVGLNAVVFNDKTLKEILNMGKFVTESKDSKISREELLDKVLEILEEMEIEGKVSKKTKETWISGKDTDFGPSIAVVVVGTDNVKKAAKEVTDKIKEYGASFTEDNYGTCFLSFDDEKGEEGESEPTEDSGEKDSSEEPTSEEPTADGEETTDGEGEEKSKEDKDEKKSKCKKKEKKEDDSKKNDSDDDEEEEEFAESERLTFIDESYNIVDLNDFILRTSLEVMEEETELENIDSDLMTEGTNVDATKEFINMKKEMTAIKKSYRKALKENNFTAAKKEVEKIKALAKKTKKTIDGMESDILSTSFGIVARFCLYSLKYLISYLPSLGLAALSAKNFAKGKLKDIKKGTTLSVLAGIGGSITSLINTITAIYNLISEISVMVTKLKSGDGVVNSINLYKNKLVSSCDTMVIFADNLITVINNKEKKYKEKQKSDKDKAKTVKESAEYKEKKLHIYEACQKGEITVDERETLLNNLNRERLVSEAVSDAVSSTGLDKKEKYDEIVKTLYEKCNENIISVAEREYMINKAYKEIFTEADNNSQPNDADAKKIEEEQKKAQKDMQNEAKKMQQQSVVN